MKKLILSSSAAALTIATMTASAWLNTPGYVGPYAPAVAAPAMTAEQQQAMVDHQQAIAEQQAAAMQKMVDDQRKFAEQWAEEMSKNAVAQAKPWAAPGMPPVGVYGERPAMPRMPDFPAFGKRPAMPQMPEFPAFSERPAMPQMPEFPAFGERPAMPQMPEFPSFVERPSLPEFQGMAVPEIEFPGVPRYNASVEDRKAQFEAIRAEAMQRFDARRAKFKGAIERRRATAPQHRFYRATPMPVTFGSGTTSECAPAAANAPQTQTDTQAKIAEPRTTLVQ
ncbi:MAG: hypothetical protein WBG92_14700 [Thiohalocapsa sp.]